MPIRKLCATLAVLTGASALVAPALAQAATTTACASGVLIRTSSIPYPSPTVNLGTSCAGFADAGAPYVFTIARLNAVYHQFPMNAVYTNVTATCSAYSYSGTSLVATGCTYVF
ncbi:hypothetical protein [Amycolatopsis rifamycinica]|uniref:Uncharacterized protein n=1 Tax=Amycolatopsis rifamycinica TaxID=287986 RepID=A0A066UIU4_9PSEU|nr:hypothetical protein [Amycolatopsis rifamycinica]KDN24138.1 hypothetical protein DV20_00150 [Amycolatopsis rifamycinica]